MLLHPPMLNLLFSRNILTIITSDVHHTAMIDITLNMNSLILFEIYDSQMLLRADHLGYV